ncbi:MAG: hypothetical protein LCH81_00995 [Bacteroidetes bacterium]|nr:hypothetical protein [Bacteroidota bacterium]
MPHVAVDAVWKDRLRKHPIEKSLLDGGRNAPEPDIETIGQGDGYTHTARTGAGWRVLVIEAVERK